jgi:hypothetical protein
VELLREGTGVLVVSMGGCCLEEEAVMVIAERVDIGRV